MRIAAQDKKTLNVSQDIDGYIEKNDSQNLINDQKPLRMEKTKMHRKNKPLFKIPKNTEQRRTERKTLILYIIWTCIKIHKKIHKNKVHMEREGGHFNVVCLRYAPFRSLLHQLATAYGLRSLRRRTPKQSLRYGVPPLKT